MKILVKNETKRLKGFKFRTFMGRFEVSDITGVKGLT